MRSYRLSAAVLALVAVMGCGSDNGPSNSAPVAKFSGTTDCVLLACTFTDASTDADGTIASRAWTFEGGTPATSTEASPAVTFAAAGTYSVKLTVTDNLGLASAVADSAVTVSATPANTNPTAEFDASCNSLDCSFADQSTDPDAGDAIASWAWDFGDGATSTEQNPAHSYTVTELTSETVTLTVTDNNGGTDVQTHTITLAPPAGLNCAGADCSLDLPSAAVVTVTLVSEDCNADGNTFIITQPAPDDTLFTDGCHSPAPGSPEATFTLNNGAAYTAGTQLQAKVVSGSVDLGFTPTIRVTGAFPDWTLEFDDGEGCPGDATCGGTEPDFNDLVMTVHAAP